jgi:uncharacterized membrane protein HdeD (DUF308 family)
MIFVVVVVAAAALLLLFIYFCVWFCTHGITEIGKSVRY